MFCHHIGMLADTDFLALPPPPRIYRQFFTPEEILELDGNPPASAVGEIALLRILITRVLAAALRKARLTLASRLSILIAFCQVVTTIASLARYEFKRRDPPPSPLELWARAMDEIDPLLGPEPSEGAASDSSRH